MQAIRSTLCCVLILALAATAPGLAPYAAAGDVVNSEARGAVSGPTVSGRLGSQITVLPSIDVRTLPQVTTIPAITDVEGAGAALTAIPTGAGLIQTGITGVLNISPGTQPAAMTQPAATARPEAKADLLAPVAKDIQPDLQLIAEPKSSGESSSRAGEDVTTVLQGGHVAAYADAVAVSVPGAQILESGHLERGSARAAKSSLRGALFGAGVLSLGTVAAGGLASGLLVFPLMVASFVLHEVAHARVAYWLGDPGPMLDNRGSLRPRDWGTHFDWLGTFVLPVASYFTLHAMMGYANPVQFDSGRFKKTGPVLGAAIAAFAGPAANLVLAGLGALVFAALGSVAVSGIWVPVVSALSLATGTFAVMNAALAAYNLVPLYPFDGHFIAKALIPRWAPQGIKDFIGFIFGEAIAKDVAARKAAQAAYAEAVRRFGEYSEQTKEAKSDLDQAQRQETVSRVSPWIPIAMFMGVIMKFGLVAMAISWLATLLLGGPGAAALHYVAAAAVPAAAGLMVGRMRDTGVPKLSVQPQVAEHRFMKERLAQVRLEMSNVDDGEWKDSLERQADGYAARVSALETQYPALTGR